MKRNLTIKDIEQLYGIRYDMSYEKSGLSDWYHNVREYKVSRLSDGDVARFIRQDLYLEFMVMEGIERLYDNPMLGDMYDGELIGALSRTAKSFWQSHVDNKNAAKKFLLFIQQSNFVEEYEWDMEDEKIEFIKAMERLEENTK